MGCFVHECMTGHSPFESDDVNKMHRKIAKGMEGVKPNPHRWGNCMELYELVKELCKIDPADRLPAHGPEYEDNVRHHEAYKMHNFDWSGLQKLDQSLVVYKPVVKSLDDTSAFGKVGADEMPPVKKYDAKHNPGINGGKWLNDF